MTNTSAITPVIPAASRLERNLAAAEEILARVRASASAAGWDAMAYSRVTIYTAATTEVDALAAAWGSRAAWEGAGRYVTRAGDGPAEAEAVYVKPATGNGAAA